MQHLAIWSGILILLLFLNCLESRSDLGGHSEVKQNVDGKDNRPFVRHSRGISDFHGSGVGWRSNEDPARAESHHDAGENDEHLENEITTPAFPEADYPVIDSDDDKWHTPHVRHEAAPGDLVVKAKHFHS
ncbi:hypothetical protein BV898_18740 [Hypsibius exemplaris]|uniref:Uncharacterized protein n=1 Tax=Hypsibius exemplaris TaxID=2072580 RepID=A0A9X6NIB1_HYPEX|nr:hypothetical protein BV898_18740 [Hypsibius exemplaris]